MLSSRGFRRENIRRFRVFLCEAFDSLNLYVRELGAFLPIRLYVWAVCARIRRWYITIEV